MTRRELLGRMAVTAGAAALVPRAGVAQQRPAPPPTGDQLYDPSMVQQRGVVSSEDNDPKIKSLEHRLKCTCGCNLDIYTCRTTDFTCTYSPALHREVMALVAAGKPADEVVTAFVTKYGESILMEPEPRGFNLAGYLLPGALVLFVGALLAAVLVRRGRLPQPSTSPPIPPAGGSDPAEDERLRRALSEIED